MAAAEVGALRVVLGMDIAQFSEGAKKAEDVLGRFANRIGITAGLAAIAGQAIGDALTRAAEKVVEGIKSAIDSTAEMADTADKFGISIQTVSAIVRDGEVPIATLTSGFDELGQSIFKVFSGDSLSTAARAFAAIGVSALDASGNMRAVRDVVKDVADKFSGYQDGAAKSALATALFGAKGTELVAVLSKGSAGIKEMTDDAVELGTALDANAGAQAKAFKAAITDLTKSFDIFYQQIAVQLLPTFKFFSDEMSRFVTGAGAQSVSVAKQIGDGFRSITGALIEADGWLVTWGLRFSQIVREVPEILKFNFTEARRIVEETNLAIKLSTEDTAKAIARLHEQPSGAKPEDTSATQVKAQAPLIASTKSLNDAQRELNQSISAGQALALQALTPYELLGKKLDNLGDAYRAAKIDAETLARAQQQATLVAVGAYANAASGIASSLTQVFQKSKGVAIAAAIINSFQAATNALAQAPWPLNYVAAAAALAAGFVQVQNIRKTTEGGGGGGGASASAPAASAGPTQAPQQLRIEGINPNQFYSGGQVRGLVDSVNDFVRNGGVLLSSSVVA